jgi:hypothetical protein
VKLAELERSLGRRFARMTTNAVVARPWLWRIFRPLTQAQFDRIAPSWDSMRRPESFAALERALETLPGAPKRVLDLGTGTGLAAFVAARRYPEAEVVGVDLAPGMVEQARRNTPPELAGNVRFEQADAVALPFEDGTFDLAWSPPAVTSSCRSPPGRKRRSGSRPSASVGSSAPTDSRSLRTSRPREARRSLPAGPIASSVRRHKDVRGAVAPARTSFFRRGRG